MRWADPDMVPPTIHHFNGKGSIAYGTNIIKSMYQTMHSRSENPTHSPMKPDWQQNISISHGVHIFNWKFSLFRTKNCLKFNREFEITYNGKFNERIIWNINVSYLVDLTIAKCKWQPNVNNYLRNISKCLKHKFPYLLEHNISTM